MVDIFPAISVIADNFIVYKLGTNLRETDIDSYTTGQDYSRSLKDVYLRAGQAFNNSYGNATLNKAKFYLKKTNSPTGNITASLFACTGTVGSTGKGTGSALATSGTIAASTLTTSYAWYTFTFSTPYTLVNGTDYVLVCEYTGNVTNYIDVGSDNSSSTHPGNNTQEDQYGWYSSSDDCLFQAITASVLTGGTGVLFNLPDVTSESYVTIFSTSIGLEDVGVIEVLSLFVSLYWQVKGKGNTRWQVSGDGGLSFVTIHEFPSDFDTLGIFSAQSYGGTGTWLNDSVWPGVDILPGDDKFQIRLQSKITAGSGSTLNSKFDDSSLLYLQYRRKPTPNVVSRVITLFPWSSPTQLPDPGILPTGAAFGVGWDTNGDLVAIGHTTTPFITIYQRTGLTFTKIADPDILPTGNGRGVKFSPDGQLMVIAHWTTPFESIYQHSDLIFTKLADPATPPSGTEVDVDFSPNGVFMAVSHVNSPYITIYKRSGFSFTKIADPDILPTGTGYGVSFSPNGEFVAVAHTTIPFVTIYQIAGTTFTKLANPATLPTGNGTGIAWSPDSQFLAVSHVNSPFITVYQRSGTTFTKIPDPAVTPGITGGDCSWHPNGEFLAVTSDSSPFITIYQLSDTILTKLSDLSPMPGSASKVARWSPNGEFLIVGEDLSPFIRIYHTAGTLP